MCSPNAAFQFVPAGHLSRHLQQPGLVPLGRSLLWQQVHGLGEPLASLLLRHLPVTKPPSQSNGDGAAGRFLSYGDLEAAKHFPLGEAKQRNCRLARNKRHTRDGPSYQPIVAGVFPHRDVGTVLYLE